MLESEVDAGSKECGCNDQTANLDIEASAIPWVAVKHDTTDVTWIYVSIVPFILMGQPIPRHSATQPKNRAMKYVHDLYRNPA